MAKAKRIIHADITRVAALHNRAASIANEARTSGSKARNIALKLVPSIHASDHISRACQRAGGAPRIARTSPENPASVTAIWAVAKRKPSGCACVVTRCELYASFGAAG